MSVIDEERRDLFPWLLALVALVGLAIRVAFVAIKQSSVKLAGDAFYYHMQAQAVAGAQGFLEPLIFRDTGQIVPAADHPPGFVLLLAAANKVGITSENGQRYLMCVLGVATIVVVGLLGRKLFGRRFGLIAAGICAIYPQVWINDGMLMSETLYVFSLVVSLYFIYDLWQKPGWPSLVWATLALAVASFTRPESVLLFLLMLVPVVLGRDQLEWRKRAAMIGGSALIAAAVFAPWVVYNLGRFEKPVYLSTGMGQTLLAANCDDTYSGKFLGWYSLRCIGENVTGDFPPGDRSVTDVELRNEALDYMSDHRGELPKVILAREGRMWGVWKPDQMARLNGWIEGRGSVELSRWADRSYWVLAALAIPGMMLWRRRRVPMYPLIVQFGLTAFVAALTFGVTRYRAGAEISIILFATITINWALTRLQARRRESQTLTEARDVS